MKKVLLPFAIAAILSACSTEKKQDEKREMVILNDSSMLYKNNVLSDTGASIIAEPTINEPVIAAKPIPKKSITRTSSRNKKSSNSPVRSSVPENTTPLPSNTGTSAGTSTTPGDNSGSGTVGTVDNTTTTAPEKKEGWSKAAKGATIGGVTGAVAGAVLSKKKGTGAVIGGVIGAAGGYILGRKKDKADGRTTTGN